ncbi:spore germination protein GerPE [Halobacillus yeomjeoni]|uniref:spore germination protein GerPE n=1 Tax=Halobacillus yeomjeoni TaxID=311194 RepID=UPI001CD54A44|nr:spore germination protein GerPE [Halobacillus yeomjeoni]MCA0983854.1 spore germination protein GerPE [Halobacillus yeomjeoni]
MIKRMVYVNHIEVKSVTIGSVMEVGDVYRASPTSTVLAVQKEGEEYTTDTFNYEDYPIFSIPPSPPLHPIEISSFYYHNSPIIVDHVSVKGLSTAAVLQIGGIDHFDASSRTKHIRIINNEP